MGIRRIRSVIVSLLGAALLVTVGAAPASADEPVPVPPPDTFAAGELCPFQVTITTLESETVQRTLPFNTLLFTGLLVVEVTNDETGESVVLDVSGPGTVTFRENGTDIVIYAGPSLIPLGPFVDPTGELGQGLYYLPPGGLMVIRNGTLIRVVGPTEDLCETLA